MSLPVNVQQKPQYPNFRAPFRNGDQGVGVSPIALIAQILKVAQKRD
jgi:hypothetical protein